MSHRVPLAVRLDLDNSLQVLADRQENTLVGSSKMTQHSLLDPDSIFTPEVSEIRGLLTTSEC